jgi:hypothetical protein
MAGEERSFGYGQMEPGDAGSEFNVICFVVRQMMARLSTMKLVQVKAVHGGGGAIAAAGTVDVLPLVNQIDGNNNATPHGTVYGIPWFRLQGGGNAVVCDPEVDDVGFVLCSDRDISNVKATRKQANPGSRRKFDLADGVYVGSVLPQAPTQWVRFTSDGVEIGDAHGNVISMRSDGIHVTGGLIVTGAITATGGITAGFGGGDAVTLQHHLHTSSTPGNPTSAPTAGT